MKALKNVFRITPKTRREKIETKQEKKNSIRYSYKN